MIFIKKLERPTKRSGFVLGIGKTTTVRGLVITNNSKSEVYVDKFCGYGKKDGKK
jgi:hypothetical protein